MIKENKKKLSVISLGLLLLAGWFYWFQYRPAKVRSNCHSWVVDLPGDVEARDYEFYYEACLHRKDLQ